MRYSAIHKGLLIKQEELQYLADCVKYSMKKYRVLTGIPLGKRTKEESFEDIDDAEKTLLDGLQSIGIDLGVQWGADLDLTD